MNRKTILKLRRLVALAISASLFANAAYAYDPDCTIRADSVDQMAEEIEQSARSASGEVCATYGNIASEELQSIFLDRIRKDAISRMEKLKLPLTDKMLKDGAEQVAQMRAFMALTTAEIGLPKDDKTLQSMTLPTDKVVDLILPVKLHNPTGLPDPEPFTEAEMRSARAGLMPNLELLRANARNRSIAETNANLALGNNPEAPVAGILGDMKRAEEEKLRSMGQVGFSAIVAKNPYLLFVTKSKPTKEDLKAAHAVYVKAVSDEQKRLRELSISPPEGTALSLIYFGPSVGPELTSNLGMCAAFNALKEKAEKELEIRNLTNLGLGVAAGATCVAAGALSFGMLAAGCFALSAAELASGTVAALDANAEANLFYGNVLQGGDIDQYQDRLSDALAFSVGAGFSAVGALGSGVQVARAVRRGGNALGSAEAMARPARMGPFTQADVDKQLTELEAWGFRRKDPSAPVRLADDADVGEDIPLSLSGWTSANRDHPALPILLRLQSKYGSSFTYTGHLLGRYEETLDIVSRGTPPRPVIRLGRLFLDDPDAAAKMLSQYETRLARADTVKGMMVRQGYEDNLNIANVSGESGTIQGLELNPLADSTNEAARWMRRRMDRYGIKYVIDDSKFVGETQAADAFAQSDTVYLRSRFLTQSAREQKELIAHESTHARISIAGQSATQPSMISFRQVGRQAVGPGGYTQVFRSDELEAWALSLRYGRRGASSVVSQFKGMQMQYLMGAKAAVEKGGTDFIHQLISAQGKAGAVKIPASVGGGKWVDVIIPFPQGTVFRSEADAQAFFLDVINRRLRQVANMRP